MLHLGGISDLHIDPAEDQDICQIDQDQIPGLPLRDRKINAAGNRQKKYQQRQEQNPHFLQASGKIKGII